MYRDEHKGATFTQKDAWEILKTHAKWDAPDPVDLTGEVLWEGNKALFGQDVRPHPADKSRAGKKSKSKTTTSTGESNS